MSATNQNSQEPLKYKSKRPTIAILGAGIMGSSVALFLEKINVKVVLIDAAPFPFMGASRWNEGKIHLGYLYAADPSLNTARKLIPGGLSFPALVKELIDRDLDENVVTTHNDTYLIHRNSLVSGDSAFALAQRISTLTQDHPDANNYFVSLSKFKPRRLTKHELNNQYNTNEILSGYEVPERSVLTHRLADYYVEALDSSSQIECLMGWRVLSVGKCDEKHDRWMVETVSPAKCQETLGPFDAVVNALWEGRGAIDASVGIERSRSWTHRFRVSLFARTFTPVNLRSAVIAVGPFGDVRNYDGNNLYLSWYNAGLLIENHELCPPPPPKLSIEEQTKITQTKLKMLGKIIPAVQNLHANLETCQVRGGWVYAAGQGSLADPRSGLHCRDKIGLVSQQGYFSIDTGKYSIAPWLAQQVAIAVREKTRV